MISNRQIYEARIPLAKIANAELPLPLLFRIVPLLEECEPVIDKASAYREQESAEDFERYMGGVRELPSCVIPALPEFRLSYVELKKLDGIIIFEEVE